MIDVVLFNQDNQSSNYMQTGVISVERVLFLFEEADVKQLTHIGSTGLLNLPTNLP